MVRKEGVAVESFSNSSFGVFWRALFESLLRAESTEKFMLLADGWSMARGRVFVSTFIGLSGGTADRHFSRFDYLLGGAFDKARPDFWAAVIRLAAGFVAEGEPIRLKIDDETPKCSGPWIEGAARYRKGAGTARQEYRTLFGLNFVPVVMSIPVPLLPGHFLSIPVGST